MLLAFGLAAPNLDAPSLWHDELVHVYVAKSIAEGAGPRLPSGSFYPSTFSYHALLALPIALFGDGPAAVRLPSGALSSLNVLLLYLLTRRLLGRETALVAAFLLAFSPWAVAWARQARMYTFQQGLYLVFLLAAWEVFRRGSARHAAAALAAFGAGVLASFHSVLFGAAIAAYGGIVGVWRAYTAPPGTGFAARWLNRWLGMAGAALGAAGLTLLALRLTLNEIDQSAVFATGIGGVQLDPQRVDRWYYLRWLWNNLSIGYFLAACAGTVIAVRKEGARGLYLALAFWAPALVLTFLIGYRRPRFLFFAYPVYTALGAAAIVWAGGWLARLAREPGRRTLPRACLAVVLVLFGVRLAWSTALLAGDALEAARGAHTTLAVRHPQWAGPCAWVQAERQGEAVLTTTFLPVHYYLGHVDGWFPSRFTWWEVQESGCRGLDSLEALQAFTRDFPNGFFIAESSRFEMWKDHGDLRTLREEFDWVEANMTRIPEASSPDVTVYRWRFAPGAADDPGRAPLLPRDIRLLEGGFGPPPGPP